MHQWFLFGYSLAFSSRSVNDRWTFWGGTSGLVFHNVLTQPVGNDPGPRIPEIAYAFFQEMFACFTWVSAYSRKAVLMHKAGHVS
jgi:Amt family ammonium transporter